MPSSDDPAVKADDEIQALAAVRVHPFFDSVNRCLRGTPKNGKDGSVAVTGNVVIAPLTCGNHASVNGEDFTEFLSREKQLVGQITRRGRTPDAVEDHEGIMRTGLVQRKRIQETWRTFARGWLRFVSAKRRDVLAGGSLISVGLSDNPCLSLVHDGDLARDVPCTLHGACSLRT